ncbi:TerB family tellurite resistance protein [Oceaniradius stylonematis]|uniref:tellurite resistance TerB family protein n=1 Tax=Oceaniradius stylonematis TaxID=2184161 RepID=UPI003C7ACCB7
MLDRFRSFVRELVDGADGAAAAEPHSPQLAAAALMYHVIQADGVLRPVERERFAAVLGEEYSLDKTELETLIKAARQADGEAVDLYRFTSILMNTMSASDRIGFIEILWEMVYADGVRHELEDNVVWRISELLGVSGRDRVLMRQRVQERLGIEGGDEG